MIFRTGMRTAEGDAAAVLLQYFYLELQGELVGGIFAHVLEVSIEVVELNGTETRTRDKMRTNKVPSHRRRTYVSLQGWHPRGQHPHMATW